MKTKENSGYVKYKLKIIEMVVAAMVVVVQVKRVVFPKRNETTNNSFVKYVFIVLFDLLT